MSLIKDADTREIIDCLALAYVLLRILRPSQLWRTQLDTGKTEALTRAAGEITGYAWAPDGTRAVLVVRHGGKPPVTAANDGVLQFVDKRNSKVLH